jgi:hypothetical protein
MLFTSLLLLLLSTTAEALTAPVTCLSWDGVVADATDWRIEQGIQAALQVWPSLHCGGDDSTWLQNKMRAIAPHLGGLEDYKSVEYALLARLLLEEQQLDPSVGKRGKYASQFHPQGPKSIAIPSARSSRPLTVGEIQANWLDNLLDTVMIKYAVDKKNPVPILQECIDELQTRPQANSLVCDAIQDTSSQVVIVVPRESELPMAIEMLPDLQVATMDNLSSSSAFVVGSEFKVLKGLCEQQSEINFVGSNWAALQKTRRLFDEHPQLSMSLTSWTASAPQNDQANMDPALNLVTEDQVLELLSARIVKAS